MMGSCLDQFAEIVFFRICESELLFCFFPVRCYRNRGKIHLGNVFAEKFVSMDIGF